MARKRRVTAVVAFAFMISLLGLLGCDAAPVPEPIDGGTVTDGTDPDAPKVIESKDIAAFHASFMLYGEWAPGYPDTFFTFEVAPDASGALVASELTTGVSAPADAELLAALQAVVDEHGLAALNGRYRVTAGLPPEFGPCSLNVDYASGENLAFTENNEPDAQWAKETYLVFAGWFAGKGVDALLPPQVDWQIERLSIAVIQDGTITRYSGITVGDEDAIDGETYLLMRDIYDNEAGATVSTDFVLFPADYYERVSEIFARHDTRVFDSRSALYGMGVTAETLDNPWSADLQIHVENADGSRFNVNTNDPASKELLEPLLEELIAYHDSLFEQE